MYKLYNVKAWGSLCIHFMLEEMEIPYTNIWMTPAQVSEPEFRDISPLGYIPALGLSDGSALFESAAIVTFLVTAHADKGLSPPPGTPEFGEFLAWLHFMSTNLYPAINMGDHGNIYARNADDQAFIASKSAEQSQALWAIIEKRLASEGPWLMGEHFSALDVYAFMLSLWNKPGETVLLEKFPAVARLVARLRSRPELLAALEAHGVSSPRS
jgi:glutathione S-transferase